MSDNFLFDITSGGDIRPWLDRVTRDGHISHVRLVEGTLDPLRRPRIVFYWSDPTGSGTEGAQPMVGAVRTKSGLNWVWKGVTIDMVAATVTAWLASADFGKQPDHDGDNEKGWHLYNESWGHVDGPYAVFAVEPSWQMYGK
jgi:hypothetical protein